MVSAMANQSWSACSVLHPNLWGDHEWLSAYTSSDPKDPIYDDVFGLLPSSADNGWVPPSILGSSSSLTTQNKIHQESDECGGHIGPLAPFQTYYSPPLSPSADSLIPEPLLCVVSGSALSATITTDTSGAKDTDLVEISSDHVPDAARHDSLQLDAAKPANCGTCGISFSGITALRRHEKKHTQFTCGRDGCCRSFSSLRSLERHQQKAGAHLTVDSPMFRCACGRPTTRKDHHQRHLHAKRGWSNTRSI
ncbi:hypothetical protein GGTG_11318 [Gaeumannomyces tritici R3-111a-1]|uniref:C2H2-type domain-containing protein n=1 Tax=Gaeumannomyces tritici (strain R3-111a-1) TaxID=644352 RepID=J3PCU9_GAET3|nr:hypothetical protein GGTG_11318 [Gaeumannomyces tritici R3-111a-1]EJT72070.1 hypothetical protein GGTG_11318 [Gaeumannomyces tritici R3-111a-1]